MLEACTGAPSNPKDERFPVLGAVNDGIVGVCVAYVTIPSAPRYLGR